MKFRRVYQPGGTYFFTQVTWNRYLYFSNEEYVSLLWLAINSIQSTHPFELISYVIMPDHIHTIWQLPEEDSDYSGRWMLIKSYVTRNWKVGRKSDIPFWQNRYWEHTIRDADDLRRHIDYIHYNPVKHGLVSEPSSWRQSSYNTFYVRGDYPQDWGMNLPPDLFSGETGE
jgi:putative transposase